MMEEKEYDDNMEGNGRKKKETDRKMAARMLKGRRKILSCSGFNEEQETENKEKDLNES